MWAHDRERLTKLIGTASPLRRIRALSDRCRFSTDDDREALIVLLRETIAADRFLTSPIIRGA
jgi:hypothetical protein